MNVAFGDGINHPHESALKRAYVRRYGIFNDRACRWIQGAMVRIERKESSLASEIKRIEGRGFRLW